MQHPTALVQSTKIGRGTRIWAFVNILPGAVIGQDCNICDHVFIENQVRIGDRVTIKCGVSIWDGVTIEDDVFVGPGAAFTNDRFPRSKQYLDRPVPTWIRQGASIGANATIIAGTTVGVYAMVGAGAVVTHDVPPYAIVVGNPARVQGYVCASPSTPSTIIPTRTRRSRSGVPGVKLYELVHVIDLRGSLSAAEVGKPLPFVPQRCFLVFDVPSVEVRGEHAHKKLHQFLICLKGSVSIVVDDGKHRQEHILDRPSVGLYIPPLIWGTQYHYTPDAMLLVLASALYDADDYIRDYDEFLRCVSARSRAQTRARKKGNGQHNGQ